MILGEKGMLRDVSLERYGARRVLSWAEVLLGAKKGCMVRVKSEPVGARRK